MSEARPPSVPVHYVEAFDQLHRRLTARNWACELDAASEDPVLRVRPSGDALRLPLEIGIRVVDGEAYFAYAQTGHGQIAPVSDIDRAVREIEFVHGGDILQPPFVSPALVWFATVPGRP